MYVGVGTEICNGLTKDRKNHELRGKIGECDGIIARMDSEKLCERSIFNKERYVISSGDAERERME